MLFLVRNIKWMNWSIKKQRVLLNKTFRVHAVRFVVGLKYFVRPAIFVGSLRTCEGFSLFLCIFKLLVTKCGNYFL